MNTSLINPYADLNGRWLRGSFHGHCDENSRCASVPLADSVRDYQAIGADFVTLTDHDLITDLTAMADRYEDLCFLNGFEYSTRENVLFIGPGVRPLYEQSLEDALAAAADLLTIVCHPKPTGLDSDYWTREKLCSLGTWPDGIEIFNGHYGTPTALANGRWPLYDQFYDELLTAGHRLWCFANDDFHDPEDFDNAFNMLLVTEATPAAIVDAAMNGRSYASTGLRLVDVTVVGSTVNVTVDDACEGSFVGPGGERLSTATGRTFTYEASDQAYVRFQAEGESGRIFLQPMFRSDG
jgi:hypothetical protein